MAVAWPTANSFPPKAYSISHVEHAKKARIRTKMDTGPAKLRKRATAVPKEFDIELRVNKAQLGTWDDWWENTSAADYGTEEITWLHPRKDTEAVFRFVTEPVYTALSGDKLWTITFRMEIMP
jgi:hypothetical protein